MLQQERERLSLRETESGRREPSWTNNLQWVQMSRRGRPTDNTFTSIFRTSPSIIQYCKMRTHSTPLRTKQRMCRHVGPKFMPMAWWVPVCELLLYNLDLIGSTFRIGTPIQSSRVNGTRTRRSNNNNERTMVKGAERVEWQFLQQKAEQRGNQSVTSRIFCSDVVTTNEPSAR